MPFEKFEDLEGIDTERRKAIASGSESLASRNLRSSWKKCLTRLIDRGGKHFSNLLSNIATQLFTTHSQAKASSSFGPARL